MTTNGRIGVTTEGSIEVILYSLSIVLVYPAFIGIWMATKYIPVWRTWTDDPVARTFFNRGLFGTGLSILLGVTLGGIARWALGHTP